MKEFQTSGDIQNEGAQLAVWLRSGTSCLFGETCAPPPPAPLSPTPQQPYAPHLTSPPHPSSPSPSPHQINTALRSVLAAFLSPKWVTAHSVHGRNPFAPRNETMVTSLSASPSSRPSTSRGDQVLSKWVTTLALPHLPWLQVSQVNSHTKYGWVSFGSPLKPNKWHPRKEEEEEKSLDLGHTVDGRNPAPL